MVLVLRLTLEICCIAREVVLSCIHLGLFGLLRWFLAHIYCRAFQL